MTAYIWLRNREGIVVGTVTVDDEDFHLARYGWCLNANGYAWRSSRGEPDEAAHVYLHRAIMGLHKGDAVQVDHINRRKLDNRRSNLRLSDNQTNKQNVPAHGGTSAFRGVHFDKARRKWSASCQQGRRGHFLGRYATEVEAAQAASRYRAANMPYSDDARD